MGISPSEMIRRLESVIPKIEIETPRIIQRDTKTIAAKYNEFKRGERPNGSDIGYYRYRPYELFKRAKNPLAGGTVDLILTGAFTRGLFIDLKGNNKYLFDSNDEKSDDLFGKYGDDLRVINENTWNQLQKESHAPLLIRYIKRQLGQ